MGKRIVVVGGGPGGYVAAIRAAQMGTEVHLVEKNKLGGSCLNAGCIPTKALLHTGEFYRRIKGGLVAGVKAPDTKLDWPEAQKHKNRIVARLTGGVAGLLRHNGVTVHNCRASLLSGRCVGLEGKDQILKADAVILATGSSNIDIKFPGSNLSGVIDSIQALSLEQVPSSMVIVGGGVIGVEFASLYSALGTKVTIVEMMEEILPQMDRQIAAYLHAHFKREGVRILTGSRLTSVESAEDALSAAVETAGGEVMHIPAEKVLVCVGRKAHTEGLGLEKLGISLTGGAVAVDEKFETSQEGIFAIGDCNAKVMLAHAASAQGEAAVAQIMGKAAHYNPDIIPSCVYTIPEIASVGLTEQEVKAKGMDCKIGIFHLNANAKSLIEDSGGGMIKIIAEARYGKLLGAHMIGPRVTDIIAEAALCMSLEAGVEEIARTIHPHPTVSEAVAEAAMAAFGRAVHAV